MWFFSHIIILHRCLLLFLYLYTFCPGGDLAGSRKAFKSHLGHLTQNPSASDSPTPIPSDSTFPLPVVFSCGVGWCVCQVDISMILNVTQPGSEVAADWSWCLLCLVSVTDRYCQKHRWVLWLLCSQTLPDEWELTGTNSATMDGVMTEKQYWNTKHGSVVFASQRHDSGLTLTLPDFSLKWALCKSKAR